MIGYCNNSLKSFEISNSIKREFIFFIITQILIHNVYNISPI